MQTQLAPFPPYQMDGDDRFTPAANGINYNVKNPLAKLMNALEEAWFFAEDLQFYIPESVQFLFPFHHLELWGPSGPDKAVLDPTLQDNKTDFQKQNIKDFLLTDTWLARGWVNAGGEIRPFLKLSYLAGPDSTLSRLSGNKLDAFIYLWLRVGENSPDALLKVPYNNATGRYEVELWGYPDGNALYNQLTGRGREALQSGALLLNNHLIRGTKADFGREGLDDRNMYEVAPDNLMHPLLPLKIELAWTDHTQTFWDSQFGQNYHYQFNMIYRGWEQFMQVGVSGNPHGGMGFLHYRNLVSNYKPYTRPGELARPVMPWMFDAEGQKGAYKEERSLTVDYMDLHILKPDCGIGIHRHRDNQEVFFLLTGKAYMMVGDWYKFPDRERAFEIRTLLPGSFALLKAGQLHALMNALDIDATLLMFGGYD